MKNNLNTKVLTAEELKKHLSELLQNPSTWGLKILKMLLKGKNLSKIEFSEKGFYYWLLLGSNPLFEVLICFWNPKIADSRRHDHYYSFAFVITLVGKVVQKLFHSSTNKPFIWKEEELKELSVGFIPSYQSHRIQNLSSDLAISVHIYFPRRPEIELVEDKD